MVRGAMNGRTLVVLPRLVLHVDLRGVAVALAESGAELLGGDAHPERGRPARGPGERAAAAAERGQAGEHDAAAGPRDRGHDPGQLPEVEAHRGRVVPR